MVSFVHCLGVVVGRGVRGGERDDGGGRGGGVEAGGKEESVTGELKPFGMCL